MTITIDTAMEDVMTKTWAYLRVSTSRQELDNQRLEILGFANQAGLRVDEFLEIECLPAWNIDPLEGEISVEN